MRNGKKVCNELKAVRKRIADANGIAYNPTECTHEGDCRGTCPKCESEMRYLERELDLRRMLGKAVVIAGLGLAVTSCAPSCNNNATQGDVPNPDEQEIVLEGDMEAPVDTTEGDGADSIIVAGEVDGVRGEDSKNCD